MTPMRLPALLAVDPLHLCESRCSRSGEESDRSGSRHGHDRWRVPPCQEHRYRRGRGGDELETTGSLKSMVRPLRSTLTVAVDPIFASTT